jgi:hypothetical protein
MQQHVRIADGFRSQSAEQLAPTAGGIITGLTGNPAFPSPPVELKTVQGAVDELKAALAAQAHGGTAATAEKRNKQEALKNLDTHYSLRILCGCPNLFRRVAKQAREPKCHLRAYGATLPKQFINSLA